MARRYGLWPFEDRIVYTVGTYKQVLLQAIIEEIPTEGGIVIKLFSEFLPKLLRSIFKHLGEAIINTIISASPFAKKRGNIELFPEAPKEESAGKLRVAKSPETGKMQMYRIVD